MQEKEQQERVLYRHDALLQQAHESIIVTDLGGKIFAWNNAASAIFGYSAADMLGKPLQQLYSREDHPSLVQDFARVCADESVQNQRPGWRKDGTKVWLETQMNSLQTIDSQGSCVTRIVCTSKEGALPPQRAETSSLASASLSQAILDSINVMMAVLDPDGTILAVNEAWRSAARASCVPEQLDHTEVGINYLDICRQTRGEAAEQAYTALKGIQDVLTATQSSFTSEYACSSPTGQKWYMMNVTPLAQKKGAVVAHIDITDRKHLERQRNIFTSMASHELRTPLTVLKGLTQLEKKKQARQGLTASINTLEKMETQVQHLTALVDELLDVSKIEAGRLVYQEEAIDLDALIEESVEAMQPASTPPRIVLHGRSDATILGDPTKLRQVLTNLLSNALKYSLPQEQVDVFRQTSCERVQVSIQDHGIGIPPEDRQRILEPFYRVDAASHSHISGLGMGLYISHEIITHHGGEITIESTEGQGSLFILTLPLQSAYIVQ